MVLHVYNLNNFMRELLSMQRYRTLSLHSERGQGTELNYQETVLTSWVFCINSVTLLVYSVVYAGLLYK